MMLDNSLKKKLGRCSFFCIAFSENILECFLFYLGISIISSVPVITFIRRGGGGLFTPFTQ